MCRKLAELLDVSDSDLKQAINRLELACGEPGIDLRLTSEIAAKVHMAIKQLGLDGSDTTGQELYSALNQLLLLHDGFLARRLGGNKASDASVMIPKIKKLIDRLKVPKHAWVIKGSVAKKLLLENPPKKVMKHLKYRSVESMVKREDILEIYTAIRFLETSAWQKTFTTKLKKLHPGDFEVRTIQLLILDQKRWSGSANGWIRDRGHNIVHSKEMGVILLAPMPVKKLPGLTITMLPLIIHYINEIRLYSAYLKMQQVRSDFGAELFATLWEDPGHHAQLMEQQLHWRQISQHFGKYQSLPEIFEPHIQPEDLRWRKAEDILYRLEPGPKFWYDMDFVAASADEGVVSFSLLDVAANSINKLPFEKRLTLNFRNGLWNEMLQRYLAQPSHETSVLRQLNSSVVESELIMVDDF